jgi:hypothetical protein
VTPRIDPGRNTAAGVAAYVARPVAIRGRTSENLNDPFKAASDDLLLLKDIRLVTSLLGEGWPSLRQDATLTAGPSYTTSLDSTTDGHDDDARAPWPPTSRQ